MADATPAAQPPTEAPHGRAGRNLLAAIGMGAFLGIVVVLLPVLYAPWLFSIVISVAMAIAAHELAGALEHRGVRIERWVVYAGALAMPQAAYWWGTQPLLAVFGGTVLLAMGARLLRGPDGYVADFRGCPVQYGADEPGVASRRRSRATNTVTATSITNAPTPTARYCQPVKNGP